MHAPKIPSPTLHSIGVLKYPIVNDAKANLLHAAGAEPRHVGSPPPINNVVNKHWGSVFVVGGGKRRRRPQQRRRTVDLGETAEARRAQVSCLGEHTGYTSIQNNLFFYSLRFVHFLLFPHSLLNKVDMMVNPPGTGAFLTNAHPTRRLSACVSR